MHATLASARTRLTQPRTERLVILMAITGLFLFLFGPILQAKFYVIEDHLLVTERSWDLPNWVARIIGDIQSFARFRPGYWLYHAIGGLAFGVNPHLWHAATLVWGILTCYLFYAALRKIGADIISSFIFVLLLVLSGNQNWIWINLIPQETIGMLLTAIAVWAIVTASQRNPSGRWDAVALIALALAGLVKESFVILIPALLLLRWTCQKCFSGQSWRESLRRIRVPLIIGALIFIVEMAMVMVVLLSKPGGYSAGASGLSLASFDPRRWLQIVLNFKWYQQLVLAGVVLLWASLWFDKKLNRTCLMASAVIFSVWLIPQVVLYTNTFSERYLFPAIVSVAAAIALELSILWRKRLWPLWAIGVVLMLPVLVNNVKSTTTTASWLTAETLATNRMVEFLAQNVSADRTILMAGDSGTPYGYEAVYSLPVYLKMAGSNSPFYLWPLISKGERSAMHIAASNNNTAFRYPDSLTLPDVGAIMIVDTFIPALDSKPLANWLGDSAWREVNFTEPYYAFSILDLKYVKVGEFNHKVLLPFTSGVPSGEPLMTIDPSLTGLVSASPLIETPPWPLERNPTGAGSIVWLGQGNDQGLGIGVSSAKEQPVDIVFELAPGPGRTDTRRTVELSLENSSGQTTQRTVHESGELVFHAILQPGANHFRLSILDEVQVPVQPNGDTRPLMALLRRVTVTAPKTNP